MCLKASRMEKFIENKSGLELFPKRFKLRNKFKKILLLVIYYLATFDDVI